MVRNTYTPGPQTFERLEEAPIQGSDIVQPLTSSGTYQLQFSGCLYIIYKGKKVDGDIDELYRFREAGNYQTSAISRIAPAHPVIFNSNGLQLTKETLFYEGAWTSRMISLLPLDYVPEKD